MFSPSHPLPVCGSDGDCQIIGIANGFQINHESMTPRGENDKETIKTEDRVIHCGMMSDEGVNSPGLSQFG